VKLSMRVVDQATGADITDQVGAKPARGGEGGDRGDRGERGGPRGERRERFDRSPSESDQPVVGE
jgi:polyribonucleotide nucleotidyltransferase